LAEPVLSGRPAQRVRKVCRALQVRLVIPDRPVIPERKA